MFKQTAGYSSLKNHVSNLYVSTKSCVYQFRNTVSTLCVCTCFKAYGFIWCSSKHYEAWPLRIPTWCYRPFESCCKASMMFTPFSEWNQRRTKIFSILGPSCLLSATTGTDAWGYTAQAGDWLSYRANRNVWGELCVGPQGIGPLERSLSQARRIMGMTLHDFVNSADRYRK